MAEGEPIGTNKIEPDENKIEPDENPRTIAVPAGAPATERELRKLRGEFASLLATHDELIETVRVHEERILTVSRNLIVILFSLAVVSVAVKKVAKDLDLQRHAVIALRDSA
jgi:hypothetical protein